MATTASERRPDLDWIRVGAFFLLILYHTGMFYVPWDWHVKSPHPVDGLQPLMLLTNPWRLTLLFLVSGAATRFMADKMTAGGLAKARISRLLPPLLLAIFVIVPPQSYYEVVEQAGFTGSYADFYGKYVTASGGWCDADGCLITPTYNHMWFVAYLFIYSLILAGVIALARKPLERAGAAVERALSGPGLILWPLVFLLLIRATLYARFPVTHALVDDWYNHALSFGAFMLGFMIAKSEPVKQALIRYRWVSLALAALGYAVFATLRRAFPDFDDSQAGVLIDQSAYVLDQWCAIAAVLGFGAKHLTKGGPVLSYLTLGVFPFYIVHQTWIVVAGHNLAKLDLPQGLEAAILVASTFAVCFATYEVVRRVNVLRPWFGLKPLPKGGVEARAAAA